jgi:hypothetical protein
MTSTADPGRPARGAPKFVLHDGPPYANGQIHLGPRSTRSWGPGGRRSRWLVLTRPTSPATTATARRRARADRELGPKKRGMSLADIRRARRATPNASSRVMTGEFQRLGVFGDRGTALPDYEIEADTSGRSTIREQGLVCQRARSRSTGASTAARRSPKWRSSTRITARSVEPHRAGSAREPGTASRSRLGRCVGAHLTTTPWTIRRTWRSPFILSHCAGSTWPAAP